MKSWMLLVLILLNFAGATAFAENSEDGYTGTAQWEPFQKYMEVRQEQDRVLGTSYLISGLVATAGGLAGYYNSEDPFSRGVYAVSQSVGVAAIGYGASQYWIGNEYNSFFYAVNSAALSPEQKSDLLRRFLERDREARQKTRWIKVATHSLLALVNLYNSTREDDKTVRSVLQFLSGTNAVIAFSYVF
jgi:hypothetical protein